MGGDGAAAADRQAIGRSRGGRGITPAIPNNTARKTLLPFDRRACKARNIIERTIGRLRGWRRIPTRCGKLANNVAAAVAIAAILLGWT